MVTKSDQIRSLAAEKVPTAEIAKRLGIRYQHAYNVLHRSSTAPAAQKVKATITIKPCHTTKVSVLDAAIKCCLTAGEQPARLSNGNNSAT